MGFAGCDLPSGRRVAELQGTTGADGLVVLLYFAGQQKKCVKRPATPRRENKGNTCVSMLFPTSCFVAPVFLGMWVQDKSNARREAPGFPCGCGYGDAPSQNHMESERVNQSSAMRVLLVPQTTLKH